MHGPNKTHGYSTPCMPGRSSFTCLKTHFIIWVTASCSFTEKHAMKQCQWSVVTKQLSYEFRQHLSFSYTFKHNYFHVIMYLSAASVSTNKKNINALQTRKKIAMSFFLSFHSGSVRLHFSFLCSITVLWQYSQYSGEIWGLHMQSQVTDWKFTHSD